MVELPPSPLPKPLLIESEETQGVDCSCALVYWSSKYANSSRPAVQMMSGDAPEQSFAFHRSVVPTRRNNVGRLFRPELDCTHRITKYGSCSRIIESMMNEKDSLGLIRKIYAAFGAGDIPAILNSTADDAEWIDHGPTSIPYAGRHSGKQQIEEFLQTIGCSVTDVNVTPEKFVTQGETVVMIGSHNARVRLTGAQIQTRVAHVFTVRNGKVVRWEGFSDSAHVAAAHGNKSVSPS